MKWKNLICTLLALLVLPATVKADVLFPGQKPPRNEWSEAFVALYADGLADWDHAYDRAIDDLADGTEVVLWRYPGSGEQTGSFLAEHFRASDPTGFFRTYYRDAEGRFWGYLNYFQGRRMAWVCLSDPANAGLTADEAVVAAVEKERKAIRLKETAPAVIMVAVVVAATGGLMYVFWYRGKKRL
ncbi:MAG: hypothetical protein EOM52_07570 [Clostridia bacterium]|nr:hypothetical protein [Clostridia bacterium]